MTAYITYDAGVPLLPTPACGGDVTFSIGMGFAGEPGGSFRFLRENGADYLRIDQDGKFWINGKHVTDDLLIYQAFRIWLSAASAKLTGNASITNDVIKRLEDELEAAKAKIAELEGTADSA